MKKTVTKALIFILIIFVILCFGLWYLWSVSCFSYKTSVNIDGFEIYEGVWDCFVGAYEPQNESDIIYVPDVYNNKPVKALGGYIGRGVPVPFSVPESENNKERTLVIGKNIEEINICDVSGISEIICSEYNKFFYSQNGELYDKKNNEKILLENGN